MCLIVMIILVQCDLGLKVWKVVVDLKLQGPPGLIFLICRATVIIPTVTDLYNSTGTKTRYSYCETDTPRNCNYFDWCRNGIREAGLINGYMEDPLQ